jgi:hypothetical protein
MSSTTILPEEIVGVIRVESTATRLAPLSDLRKRVPESDIVDLVGRAGTVDAESRSGRRGDEPSGG